jgi:hypothetical protein
MAAIGLSEAEERLVRSVNDLEMQEALHDLSKFGYYSMKPTREEAHVLESLRSFFPGPPPYSKAGRVRDHRSVDEIWNHICENVLRDHPSLRGGSVAKVILKLQHLDELVMTGQI